MVSTPYKKNTFSNIKRALDFDDFTGNFCNQGKYPLLNVLNHYLRPELNIRLPKSNMLWAAKTNTTTASKSMSVLNTSSKKPTYESDLLLSQVDSDSTAPHNIFGLIKNDGKKRFFLEKVYSCFCSKMNFFC